MEKRVLNIDLSFVNLQGYCQEEVNNFVEFTANVGRYCASEVAAKFANTDLFLTEMSLFDIGSELFLCEQNF